MRVANLRGSCLKNSSLKGACLAGADLEVSSLVLAEHFVDLLAYQGLALVWTCNTSTLHKFRQVLSTEPPQGCDLNGAELYNTNLRGANLTNVNFEDITTALHMTHVT